MKVYYEELAGRVEILEVILPTKEKSELSCRVNRRKGSKRYPLKHRRGDAKECGDGDGRLHLKLGKVLMKHLLKGEVVQFEDIHEVFTASKYTFRA